jgi:hypothetical protein
MIDTHVEKPGDLVCPGFGVDAALEIDVVAALDPVSVEGLTHSHLHQWLVCTQGSVLKEHNNDDPFSCQFYRIKRGMLTRETREGWPLLTVETEANEDSWIHIKGGSSLLGCWTCMSIQ